MNAGDIIYNQEQIVSELRSTNRVGIEALLSLLSDSDLYNARVDRSDTGEGSLANHILWVLRLCRETLDYAKSIGKGAGLEDDSLVIVSLLHRLPSCRFKSLQLKDPTDEAKFNTIIKKTGLELKDCEKTVLLSAQVPASSIDSSDKKALLSYILEGAKKNAFDYASGIPYSETPLEKTLPKPINETNFVFMDMDDHRLWWNISQPGFVSHEHRDMEGFERVETTAILPLVIGHDSTEPECAVLCDESGVMGFLAGYTREDDGTMFLCSDRLCFGYSDMIFFMSRYPHYRPSYVLAQRYDGKWGAFSIKASGKKRPPVVDVVPIVRHESKNKEATIRAMKSKAGYPVRVKHHLFYNEISVMDCFRTSLKTLCLGIYLH